VGAADLASAVADHDIYQQVFLNFDEVRS